MSSPNARLSRFYLLSSRGLLLCNLQLHFELISVKDEKSVSRFISLHADVQLFQHHLLRDYFFLCCNTLLLCQRSVHM